MSSKQYLKVVVSDEEIIRTFFRSSRGIKSVAGQLNIPKPKVGKVII